MQFFGGTAEMNPSPSMPAGTGTGLLGNNTYMVHEFNRNGVCLLYRDWHLPVSTLDAQQKQKLMFGLLFSLRSFTAKMDPTSDEVCRFCQGNAAPFTASARILTS